MSQILHMGTGAAGGPVVTLTGNSGGPVPPTAGNINVIGSGTITVTGNPGTSTLTISESGTVATTYQADAGSATPAANILNVVGANGITTSGAGNTLTVNLTVPVSIAHGGTNATSMSVVDGTVYYDGTSLVTTATGTSGFVLTSAGPGVAPSYQAVSASGAVTSVSDGLNITITGTATAPIVNESKAQLLTNYSVANATPYVVGVDDFYITVDTSTFAITIQLPDAPTIYRRFVIKDSAGQASIRNVTVTTVSGIKNIDAAPTFVMNTDWQAIECVYDGFGYQVF